MDIDLHTLLASKIQRKTLTQPSIWPTRYRVMGKPFPGKFSYKYHPWLQQMHDDTAPEIVGQKAAQMGYSEFAINMTLFWMDILQESVLYLLPNSKPDAADFSVGRFDPALELSDHIKGMFSDTRNIGMKKAGTAILYIRGSRSESQLKSIPTGRIIFDEFDEMPAGAYELAIERASGQPNKQFIIISTPTIPGRLINERYLESDQKHFFFRCPRCNQLEELTYPDSIVITAEHFSDPSIYDSHLICTRTGLRLPHELKYEWLQESEWVKHNTNPTYISGYHVNQLYSSATTPGEFAKAALKAHTDPYAAQEFSKSKLGLPYIEKGAQVTDSELQAASQPYSQAASWIDAIKLGSHPNSIVTMGVDVGTNLHYEITAYTFPYKGETISQTAHARVLKAGHVRDFEELDTLMRAYNVVQCVIDANPERRKASEFAARHYGKVKMCFYIVGLSNANSILINDEEMAVKVDRTSWLDVALGRFHNGTIHIPYNIDRDYAPHIKAQVRRYEQSAKGEVMARYVCVDAHDHLGHARNYSEIALRAATSIGYTQNIT